MMITKRQFGVTLMIFLTLFLLFMGFQIGKEAVATPDINKHISGAAQGGKSTAFIPGFAVINAKGEPEGLAPGSEWMLYIGDENSDSALTVKEWSYYTRTPVALAGELPDIATSLLPDVVIIEPDLIRDRSDKIAKLMSGGVDFIFTSLPDYEYVKSDFTLRKLLGIRRPVREEITLKGAHLFKGFLLGGERIFEEDPEENATEEKEKLQDLELTVPWYSVRAGTKTFMRGTLTDEDLQEAQENKLKNEDMPAIIWRSSYEGSLVFAVNGGYMSDRRAGMGLLQAMMHERNTYTIYPIINAHVFSVDNCPILTDENKEQVEKIYGKPITKVQTDIIMPMFITLSTKNGKVPSCFMSVKYDRSDPAQPQRDTVSKYLSMLSEMGGELAASANCRSGALSQEELADDLSFLKSEVPGYRVSAVMCSAEELSALPYALEAANAEDIRTAATSEYSPDLPIVGRLNESMTFQQTTSDLYRHTFTDELEYLGVQTLLGYSNGSCSIAKTFYPGSKKDEWQNSSREIFSNLTTYSNPFRAEDSVTVTDSDERIRTYLDLQYAYERSGDVITVTTDRGSHSGDCYFILRTHNESVTSVSGGEFKEIEEDAYLISAKRDNTVIRLSSTLSTLIDMEGSNR